MGYIVRPFQNQNKKQNTVLSYVPPVVFRRLFLTVIRPCHRVHVCFPLNCTPRTLVILEEWDVNIDTVMVSWTFEYLVPSLCQFGRIRRGSLGGGVSPRGIGSLQGIKSPGHTYLCFLFVLQDVSSQLLLQWQTCLPACLRPFSLPWWN